MFVGVAATALVGAGFAAAADVVVMLGPSGPQPSVVSVGWGDTLDIVNGDTVAHGLDSARPELATTSLAPGATLSAVMTGRAGTVAYHQTGPPRYNGTVVVTLTGSVSLHKHARPIVYGRPLQLSGTTQPATPVAIEERLAGQTTWETIATVTSGSDGTFAANLPLTVGGRLRASIEGGQVRSARIVIRVAPRVTLSASRHRARAGSRIQLRARVQPGAAAKRVYLYVCSPARGKWRRVSSKRVSAAGVAAFHARVVPGRAKLRAVVRQHGITPGYAGAVSRPVTVRGTGAAPRVTRPTHHHC